MQPHPGAETPQGTRQFGHTGLQRTAIPETWAVFHVHPVGAGVLRHHQQLLHARADQRLRLPHHLADRPAHQIAAHRRDDAECAAVIAALGNLQVGVVARGELDATRRNQVLEWIMRFGQRRVHRVHHRVQRVRPGNCQYLGMRLADHIGPGAEATSHNHLAVFRQGLTNRFKRFLHRGIDEPAGVHHHHVGIVVAADDAVAFGPQLGQDALGIDSRLRAPERDESDSRRAGGLWFG